MVKQKETGNKDNQNRKRATAAYADAAPSKKVKEDANLPEAENTETAQEESIVEIIDEEPMDESSRENLEGEITELKEEIEQLKKQSAE